MNRILVIGMVLAILFLIDLYVYQAVQYVLKGMNGPWQQVIRISYWSLTAASFGVILIYNFVNPDLFQGTTRNMVFTIIFITYFSKVVSALFLVVDDLIRLGKWALNLGSGGENSVTGGDKITRNEFLTKTALIAGTVPFAAMTYGIISGAHDYRIRRRTVYLPNLPASFDGMTVAQLSDIHSGSFFNKTAVQGGVDMVMKEKPDVILFTGDLVNNETSEVKDYVPIFNKLDAPLGVFSVTGNHDYGDYKQWSSNQAKARNFEDLITAHKEMGYDLLMNEHRMIEQGGDKLAIIGVENWGKGRFAKYGKLEEAYAGTEEAAAKLLLSHDPSHWDAQVRPTTDIDLMFAGHTHGFQFGVEWGNFKWSPAQYAYKQWADLYEENGQYLYVNRGFGYIGYPGRIGIPPEITLVTLKKATA